MPLYKTIRAPTLISGDSWHEEGPCYETERSSLLKFQPAKKALFFNGGNSESALCSSFFFKAKSRR